MCFIFQLPKSFGVSVLAELLSASDLVKLDVALCNVKYRASLKEWMRNFNSQFQRTIFNHLVEFPFCPKIITWASERTFNLESLFNKLTIGTKMVHLFHALDDQTRFKMLQSVENVKHLKVCGAVGGFCEIISKFKNVETIQCTNASNEMVLQFADCHGLRKFSMLKSYEVQENSLVYMTMNCPLLLELRLDGCHFSSGKNLLLSVIIHCPALRVMIIRGGHNITDRDLMIFALHKDKRTTMTELTMVNTVSDKTVTKAALHRRGLISRLMAGQEVTVTSEDTPKSTPLHCGRELNKTGLICEFLKNHVSDAFQV